MKNIITFCRRTGRRIGTLCSRITRHLAANGRLSFKIGITVPFFFTFEVSYEVELKKPKRA